MATSEPALVLHAAVKLTSIDDSRSFSLEGRHQGYCACCRFHGRSQRSKGFEVHHAIAKQRCRRERAPLYSPDNALRLCAKSPFACHERHTSHQELLPVGCLRDENLAFAVAWLGLGPAIVYFETYYTSANQDPRIHALLEQL